VKDVWGADGCGLTRDVTFRYDCTTTQGVTRWHVVSWALDESASEIDGTVELSSEGCEGTTGERTWEIRAVRSTDPDAASPEQ